MIDTTKIFHRGKEAYERINKVLFELYKFLPLKARKELFGDKNKNINDSVDTPSFKHMVVDFNMMLQYALLDLETTFPDISYIEMLFIADVAEFCEEMYDKQFPCRVDHIVKDDKKNAKMFKENTYLLLPDKETPEEILQFKKGIYEYVEPLHVNMLKAFQVINRVAKSSKKCEELLPDIQQLYFAFLEVDGRIDKCDMSVAGNMLREYFVNHIDDYKNKVKSLIK